MGRAAAFFDLDRTLLRRSSTLALASAFRKHGVITRTQVAKAALIVSAALQEVVDALAEDLGFDGALGTVCEVEGGVYTGRGIRSLHGENKAAAVRELAAAEGFDLETSTAYSDSHTDLPFLEAVGNPVAVNPDRKLRRVAAARGWPMLRFTQRAA